MSATGSFLTSLLPVAGVVVGVVLRGRIDRNLATGQREQQVQLMERQFTQQNELLERQLQHQQQLAEVQFEEQRQKWKEDLRAQRSNRLLDDLRTTYAQFLLTAEETVQQAVYKNTWSKANVETKYLSSGQSRSDATGREPTNDSQVLGDDSNDAIASEKKHSDKYFNNLFALIELMGSMQLGSSKEVLKSVESTFESLKGLVPATDFERACRQARDAIEETRVAMRIELGVDAN